MQVPNTFTAGLVAKSAEVNENFDEVEANILPTFVFYVAGTLTTGTNMSLALIVHNSLTINKAYAYVKTAPTGADILIDINLNGTSIWSATQANRLTVAAGTQTGSQTSFDSTTLAEGDIITIDIDQIGSGTAGTGLTVELRCT